MEIFLPHGSMVNSRARGRAGLAAAIHDTFNIAQRHWMWNPSDFVGHVKILAR